MERVFVTGGSGFLGRELVRELVARGRAVRGLARSTAARAVLGELGAEAVTGDLGDVRVLQQGMSGCQLVLHAAAHAKDHGPREEFFRANVRGTENVVAAARSAGVERLVHVSTEAVLADGNPIVQADEERPIAERPVGLYPLTKGLAEKHVRAAAREGFDAVVVRPRFIWGRGDTTLLPSMLKVVNDGRWRWIDGGRYLTSTCHVANAVEGLLCAAERGRSGGVYFLTDGAPVEFRSFVGDMLRAAGADPGEKNLPRWVAQVIAALTAFLPNPPITRTALALVSHEVTVNDTRARRELGYEGKKSIPEGLAELRSTTAPPLRRVTRPS
jgi:nucleoside-diphosphate-sugar epimerase